MNNNFKSASYILSIAIPLIAICITVPAFFDFVEKKRIEIAIEDFKTKQRQDQFDKIVRESKIRAESKREQEQLEQQQREQVLKAIEQQDQPFQIDLAQNQENYNIKIYTIRNKKTNQTFLLTTSPQGISIIEINN